VHVDQYGNHVPMLFDRMFENVRGRDGESMGRKRGGREANANAEMLILVDVGRGLFLDVVAQV
jgi:hypothetical protein